MLANDIVTDANKKEFEGKNSVTAIETKASQQHDKPITSVASLQNKTTQIKNKETTPNKSSSAEVPRKKIQEKPIDVTKKIVTGKASDDEWESF